MKPIFTLFLFLVTLSLVKTSAQSVPAPSQVPSTAPAPGAPASAKTSAPDQASATTTSSAPTTPAVHKPLIFRPQPVSGGEAPLRVGGGSRITKSDEVVFLETLVPSQIALTTKAQPTLYWYQSNDSKFPCEITLTEPKNPKPLLMLKANAPLPAGIHAIRLSSFPNIQLKPKVAYRWSVAVIIDPASRSEDITANGVIERIEPSPDLAAKLAQASDADKPAIYAQNGIWYDALQGISDQIDLNPKDAALRGIRSDLLKQVGLNGEVLVTQK